MVQAEVVESSGGEEPGESQGLIQPSQQDLDQQIEHAVEEMEQATEQFEPFGNEDPHLEEQQETDIVEEKMLRNGHEVREEIIETPDRKVIKVTEEGQESGNPSNVKEVKDELTKEFEKI